MLLTNFLIAVTLFAISTSFTPGPNNFLLVNSGIKFGLQKTWGHILGIAVGFPIMLFIVGILFSNVLVVNKTVFSTFSIIGMFYLLYLGYQTIFTDIKFQDKSKSKPITFLQAAFFQWVNPKAWVMSLGVVSTYILQKYDLYLQLIVISFIFFIIGLLSSVCWTLFGSFIKKTLSNPLHIKVVNILLGILLIISIIQMLPYKFNV